MAHLYILENKDKKHYIRITNFLPKKRLEVHNKGKVYSTKLNKPWHIIYLENFDSLETARVREKQIKSWHGGNAFKKLVAEAAGSSNGRTVAFGAINLGSSPSPAASAGSKNKK